MQTSVSFPETLFYLLLNRFRTRYLRGKNSISLLPVTAIGTPLIQLDTVDSSNNYAMGQMQAQLAEHGTAWLAAHQTDGKGQRGKLWQDAAGHNIILSTVIVPSTLTIGEQFFLSVAVALACRDLFSYYALHDTCIKWPNDLYWKDRKAGGILIENILQGSDWKYAIVGIGLNINQTAFDSALQNPVSLLQITGRKYDLHKLAIELCAYIEKRWQQILKGERAALLSEYNQHLYKRNEIAKLRKESAVIEARVVGVNEIGELLVDTGTLTSIPFGEVTWVI